MRAKRQGDAFDALDVFDAIDGGGVALVIEARLGGPVDCDQPREVVVADPCQVSAGAGGHAAREGSAIDDNDVLAAGGEFVCGREARDTGTDDDDIGAFVRFEREAGRCGRRRHPERATAFG